jgi:hypothetical protein
MADAAHVSNAPGDCVRFPANDNVPGHGDAKGDRWRWLIERLKMIDSGLAVFAAKERLKGMKCEAFCILLLRGARRAGWECLDGWEE